MSHFKLRFPAHLAHSALSAVVILILGSVASPVHASYPVVMNFKRTEYNGGAQNWDVAQAPDGSMLFGNSYGAMAYNSAAWTMLPVPNHTTVRAICVDGTERVYVGASGEFGYFSPDEHNGSPVYTSLLPSIPANYNQFNEVWNIFEAGRKMWFQCDSKVFCYDGTTTTCIDTGKKISCSGYVRGLIYLAFSDGTLATINPAGNLEIKQLHVDPLPADDQVCAFLPAHTGGSSDLWIVSRFNGIFRYDGHTLSPYPTDLDNYISANQAFCAAMSDDKLVIGTVKGGVAIKDLNNQQTTYLNIDSGLQNNTVLTAEFDSDGNLWLGLDNGLDYVLLNSPVYKLLGDNERFGAGYVSSLVDNTLYLGTNQGLFSTTYPTPTGAGAQAPHSLLKGQVWSIDHVQGTMFVSTDVGLYYKVDKNAPFAKVNGVGGAMSVIMVPEHDDLALVSTYDNFYAIRRNGERWEVVSPVAGYNDVGGHPLLDNDGFMWLHHWIKGVYRLHFNPDRMIFDRMELFDASRGFPTNSDLRPHLTDSGVVFSTPHGFYRHDAASNRMVPNSEYGGVLDTDAVAVYHTTPWGQTWAAGPHSIKVITGHESDPAVDSISFRVLAEKLIPGYENLNFISPSCIIVAGLEGFYDVNPRYDASSATTRDCSVRISSIHANGDSLIYTALMFPDSVATPIRIPHHLNSLRFDFVAPEFRDQNAVQYRYILRKYDSDWSSFSPASSKEYTRLHPGNYTFCVEAYNTYTGKTSSASITFTILTPWYLTILAKIIYALLILLLMWWAVGRWVKYLRDAANKDNREKEKELRAMRLEASREALSKDVEIERLKGEQLRHDIRHKSHELSNVTMNIMRKNEILLKIAERLDKVSDCVSNDEAHARVQKHVDAIKKLIRENISHDDDWRNFSHNFDIVYEKYLARLLERFPDLTQREQRLCAYIRMGLSSKEIAPLMNISYRSVEMNRYRLRKKMGIDGDTALSAFLIHFPSPTPPHHAAPSDNSEHSDDSEHQP